MTWQDPIDRCRFISASDMIADVGIEMSVGSIIVMFSVWPKYLSGNKDVICGWSKELSQKFQFIVYNISGSIFGNSVYLVSIPELLTDKCDNVKVIIR